MANKSEFNVGRIVTMSLLAGIALAGCTTQQSIIPARVDKVGPVIASTGSGYSRTAVSQCLQQQLSSFGGDVRVDTDTTPAQTTVDMVQRRYFRYRPLYRYTVMDGGEKSTIVLRMAQTPLAGPSGAQAQDWLIRCTR